MAHLSLIGKSAQHISLLEKLDKVAATDAEILISGPSGAGKEMYARFAHQHSPRRKAAFVPVNCGALPADLLENEMFGHVGGAFTGVRPQSQGLVAAAEGGTLFLDEVDSLVPICQVKLLRFLQEKEYRRLGETRIRRANVRIIAATNTDLLAAVRAGAFREDLFFRLRVIPIEVPSLQERPCDIPLLLGAYISRYAEVYKLTPITFNDEALEALASYSWPGNIRELENCVNYLTCLQLNRPIEPRDLPLLNGKGNGYSELNESQLLERPFRVAKNELVNHFEREYIENALRQSGGNIAEAARISDKPRRVFFEIMRKHGIKANSFLPRDELSPK